MQNVVSLPWNILKEIWNINHLPINTQIEGSIFFSLSPLSQGTEKIQSVANTI